MEDKEKINQKIENFIYKIKNILEKLTSDSLSQRMNTTSQITDLKENLIYNTKEPEFDLYLIRSTKKARDYLIKLEQHIKEMRIEIENEYIELSLLYKSEEIKENDIQS